MQLINRNIYTLLRKILTILLVLNIQSSAFAADNTEAEVLKREYTDWRASAFVADNNDVEEMVNALKQPSHVKTRGLKYTGVGGDLKTADRPSLSLDIPFEYDSSAITTTGKTVLDKLAKAMKSAELQLATFEVQGHTDAKGQREYNTRLSDERAKSVIKYLVNEGSISETQLIAVGKGSSELVDQNNPFSAVNRRVKIVTVK